SAATSAAVCAVQYRLAPEHPFPAALDDALTAYRWLLHHPYARSRIVFSGIAAGAGLVLSLFLKLKLEKIAMPAGGICLCPWFNLIQNKSSLSPLLPAQFYRWSSEKYLKDQDPSSPLISPLAGDFQDLPPLFLQTSQSSFSHPDTIAFAEKAEKKGVKVTLDVWPEMVHLWQMFAPRFPESQEAIERAGGFVDQLFKEKT
ncbi:MAG: alpha/beta hydrolase, partial [Chlamydiae bacterium]|nr:alpha/beta hydrolase [Chlamydiota bacterium]